MESVRLPLGSIVDNGCSASAAEDVVCGGAALQQVVCGVSVFTCGGSDFKSLRFMRLIRPSHFV